jgi:hypothetical protein
MGDSDFGKEGVQFLIFSTPIGLDSNDLAIKEPFYEVLEVSKFLKDLRFVFQKIDPCELAIIIYKTNIVFESTD